MPRLLLLACRITFAFYLVAWTTLLLVPDPYGLIVYFLGGEKGPPVATAQGGDKIIHFVGYFLVYVTAYSAAGSRWNRRWAAGVFFAGALHGAGVEVLQSMGSARKGETADWLADLAGLFAGWAVAAALQTALRFRNRTESKEPSDAPGDLPAGG